MRRAFGSSPGSGPALALTLFDAAAVADKPVEPACIDVGAELVALADHRLPSAEHQPPVLGEAARQPLERQRLLVLAQIEQHVAAQHDVETAGVRHRLEQIVHLEAYRLAQRLDGAPAVAALLEPLDHLVDSKAALHLELRIDAVAGAVDARSGDVGAEDVDRPALPLVGLVGEQHRQGIDFLAGRAAGRPDADSLALLAPRVELWERVAAEQVERRRVAEEIGLVVEQGFDHLLRQARLLPHDTDGDQLIQGRDAACPHQRGKRRLDAPSPVHRQLLTGAGLEEPGEDPARAVAYLHAWSSVRAAIRRAILSGGSIAQASPASSTARGMPQTALLASSWARMEPPQATRRDAPSTPSRPIPVSTTPSAPWP